MRANRTDAYPDFPYFTPEERKRIDKFLKEMEDKYGPLYPPFQITPRGSTEFDYHEQWKKVRDTEIAGGVRKMRSKKNGDG